MTGPEDCAFDPGAVPVDECGLIDWALDDPELDPVANALLTLRLVADSDRALTSGGIVLS